jgi:molybdenum cofactor cytidylyltransferase
MNDRSNPSDPKFIALILAAGRSSRMGEFKPLMLLEGKTVLERLLNTYLKAGVSEALVVLGHRADEIQPLLEAQGVAWIVNEHYDRGMFSSIQTGVQQLSTDCDAFFLQPADIALIRPETLQSLLTARRENRATLCYPCHDGRRGHPPLISASVIPAIEAFDKTGGMRALLARYQDAAINVDVDDPGIHFDMDTPEDYERAVRRARGNTF